MKPEKYTEKGPYRATYGPALSEADYRCERCLLEAGTRVPYHVRRLGTVRGSL